MSKLIVPTDKLFEHNHVISGIGKPYLYYRTGTPYVDGIKRGHIGLYGRCDECGKEIHVANIHTDENGKLYEIKLDKSAHQPLPNKPKE